MAMEEIENNGSSNGHSEQANPQKSLFRIGEVSRLTSTKPFVLRYWETEFPMLQPVKSPKGHRLYRREDIDTVFTIKRLLYNEGFTIAGARRHLRDQALGAGGVLGTDGQNDTNGNSLEEAVHAGDEEQGGGFAPVTTRPAAQQSPQTMPPQFAMLNRQTLLELRDSLRSLLTALESE
ncbi:MAG TPA: MerR family transcriptional regulator [Candidatus Acidoferrales bacterium]|jgi:DNA-binding transcriptional MerR regulator